MHRTTIVVTLTAAALAGAATAWWLAPGRAALMPEHATLLDAPRPLPELALVDQSGRAFGRDRFAGRWSLVFFGFTHCPDICPTTLAQLAELRRRLADLPAARLPQLVFVSVDPARDTPQVIATYLRHFDPELVGVTGGPAAIETLTRALGVPVMVGAPDEAGNYAVDHGAALFVIGPDAAWHAVASAPHAVDGLARDYRRIVALAGS